MRWLYCFPAVGIVVGWADLRATYCRFVTYGHKYVGLQEHYKGMCLTSFRLFFVVRILVEA